MQKFFQYFFKTFILGIIVSIIIFIVMVSLEVAFGRKIILNQKFYEEILHYVLYGVVLTIINSTYFHYINYKVQWERFRKYKIGIAVFGSVALTLAGIFMIRYFLGVMIDGQRVEEFIRGENHRFYIVSLLITMVVSLTFHTIYYYKKAQEKKVKEQKIIAGTASAQFESLKNQIDPHFLFNSLNVLSSLIEENPDNAQRFTTSLSKVYRYVLEQKDKELVPVQEELDFARIYMELLKMRFEGSLTYEISETGIPDEGRVVPLSLQLLLENTIKHNVASEEQPLHVHIFITDNKLVVTNNLQKKEVLKSRRGVGLQNIVDRYAILTNRQISIKEAPETFSVELPILTKQITVMETKYRSEEEAYFKAQQRVKEIKEFYGHLLSYCLVIPFLIFINYMTYWEFKWFWFPMLGWGTGLTIHAFSIFGYAKKWEERKIREIMEEEQNQKWK